VPSSPDVSRTRRPGDIRVAVEHLRARGNHDLAAITLFSDGTTVRMRLSGGDRGPAMRWAGCIRHRPRRHHAGDHHNPRRVPL
jgi:hypothetical protein